MEIKMFNSAQNLPDYWDLLAQHYFQRKSFLVHAEKFNACKQRYYIQYQNNTISAGAIVYSIRLDVLTYLKIKSPITMNIIGIPCSVSCSGLIGESDELKNYIFKHERGLVLALNETENPILSQNAKGNTLPTIILRNEFSTWEHYLQSLRSDYRRRIQKILDSGKSLEIEKMHMDSFTQEMYQQYLNVYKRSDAKLEKLSFSFFQNLPKIFTLNVCKQNDILMGWNITLHSDNTLYFFLGGINYKYNHQNATYLFLMTQIIKQGIEKKVHCIDLGQTAEIPKMRLGGKLEDRYMEAKHSLAPINFLIKKFQNKLAYKRVVPLANVFKNLPE